MEAKEMRTAFNPIIIDTLRFEGGYVKDPDDRGGETYKGISRVFWAIWAGWAIIDKAKLQKGFPGNLKGNEKLDEMVIEFYKVNFFDRIAGDQIKHSRIAKLVFDSAVNEGVVPAVKRAQGILQQPETGKINPELISQLNLLI